MDRIYNNEFLAACVIVALLKNDITDITMLTICVMLSMDDALRGKLVDKESFFNYAKRINEDSDSKVNNKYKDYLVLFVNTIVMLRQNDVVDIVESDIILTGNGDCMYSDKMKDIPSVRLQGILGIVPNLCRCIKDYDMREIFNMLNVDL